MGCGAAWGAAPSPFVRALYGICHSERSAAQRGISLWTNRLSEPRKLSGVGRRVTTCLLTSPCHPAPKVLPVRVHERALDPAALRALFFQSGDSSLRSE